MLRNSNSRSSLFSQQKPALRIPKQDAFQLCQDILSNLE